MTELTHAYERGNLSELAMVRLADEGVPIKALARVYCRPFDEIEDVLDTALSDGRLICKPASEWPAGTTREDRSPTMAVIRGTAPDTVIGQLVMAFRLTTCEARLICGLLYRESMSKGALLELVSPEADQKIVDVFVCKARKKLERFQISIRTIWGFGYRLEPDAKDAILSRIGIRGSNFGQMTAAGADAA